MSLFGMICLVINECFDASVKHVVIIYKIFDITDKCCFNSCYNKKFRRAAITLQHRQSTVSG